MDPQANINCQVQVARTILEDEATAAELGPTLAELVLALAEWLAREGFAPSWSKALGE